LYVFLINPLISFEKAQCYKILIAISCKISDKLTILYDDYYHYTPALLNFPTAIRNKDKDNMYRWRRCSLFFEGGVYGKLYGCYPFT
jgi:hypothetical protein